MSFILPTNEVSRHPGGGSHCPRTHSVKKLPTRCTGRPPPTSNRHLPVTHTSCIVGGVPADETRSASPGGPIPGPAGGLPQALQLDEHTAPTVLPQLPAGSALAQLAQHSPARGRGVQHRLDMRLDRDLGLDVPDRDRTAVGCPPLLRRRSAALCRAPPPGPARRPGQRLMDDPPAPRTGSSLGRSRPHRPLSCSSPSVQAITVADRQRRCLPTRKPCGP